MAHNVVQLLFLLSLSSYMTIGLGHEVGSIFNLTLYGDELLDDDDRRNYTAKELEGTNTNFCEFSYPPKISQ